MFRIVLWMVRLLARVLFFFLSKRPQFGTPFVQLLQIPLTASQKHALQPVELMIYQPPLL